MLTNQEIMELDYLLKAKNQLLNELDDIEYDLHIIQSEINYYRWKDGSL